MPNSLPRRCNARRGIPTALSVAAIAVALRRCRDHGEVCALFVSAWCCFLLGGKSDAVARCCTSTYAHFAIVVLAKLHAPEMLHTRPSATFGCDELARFVVG
jgi:hypothetical protein